MDAPATREVERRLDDLPKGVTVEFVDNDRVKAWRKTERDAVARGRRRDAIVGMVDPNTQTRPEQVPVDQDDTGAYRVRDSRPEVRRVEPRELIEDYQAKLMAWARADKQLFLGRARLLRETSPLQFSHLTDEQLAEQLQDHMLAELAREKARAAVERNAHRLGFDRAVDLSTLRTPAAPAAPVYLPGQAGRVASG